MTPFKVTHRKSSLPASLDTAYRNDPRTALAQALQKDALSGSPAATPWVGLARVLNAGIGTYADTQAKNEYQKKGDAYNQALSSFLSAKTPDEQQAALRMSPEFQAELGLPLKMSEIKTQQEMEAKRAEEAAKLEHDLKLKGTLGADTAATIEGQNARWQTPSGNAQLGSQTQMRGQDMSQQTAFRGQDMTQANTHYVQGQENMRHNTQSADNAATNQRMGGGDVNGIPSGDNDVVAAGIASGQLPGLTSFAMRTPRGLAIMSKVMQINPKYDFKIVGAQAKAEKDFGTGKKGDIVRSFNVADSHLTTLDQMSDALHNEDVQLFNKIGNEWAKQTGNPAPTNFDATKRIVADEITKAVIGSGGALGDREEAEKSIMNANSPEQLKGVIQTYHTLIKGQIGGLQQQYEQSTGKHDFERFVKPKTSGPVVGEVDNGYKFKGGDPANKANWEKQ